MTVFRALFVETCQNTFMTTLSLSRRRDPWRLIVNNKDSERISDVWYEICLRSENKSASLDERSEFFNAEIGTRVIL